MAKKPKGQAYEEHRRYDADSGQTFVPRHDIDIGEGKDVQESMARRLMARARELGGSEGGDDPTLLIQAALTIESYSTAEVAAVKKERGIAATRIAVLEYEIERLQKEVPPVGLAFRTLVRSIVHRFTPRREEAA